MAPYCPFSHTVTRAENDDVKVFCAVVSTGAWYEKTGSMDPVTLQVGLVGATDDANKTKQDHIVHRVLYPSTPIISRDSSRILHLGQSTDSGFCLASQE